jgi:hypothetical protein
MYCVCAGGGDEDGYEDDGEQIPGGLDDAAAAAAKGQKQKGGRARQGGSADEEATLTTPDHLRAKKGDQTFAVDPLFHTMSALFDEGGAKGEVRKVEGWGVATEVVGMHAVCSTCMPAAVPHNAAHHTRTLTVFPCLQAFPSPSVPPHSSCCLI